MGGKFFSVEEDQQVNPVDHSLGNETTQGNNLWRQDAVIVHPNQL